MTLTKNNIIGILAAIWIIFSIAYIAWDRWDRFKNGQMLQAYQSGKTEIITAALEQAQNKECKSFSISDGAKQEFVINVKCVQPSPEAKK